MPVRVTCPHCGATREWPGLPRACDQCGRALSAQELEGQQPKVFVPLAAPPRRVSAALRVRLLFGGVALAGWVFLGLSWPMVYSLVPRADWLAIWHTLAPRETVQGTVVDQFADARGTHVRYTFATANGATHEGMSYVEREGFAVGATVTVEYPRGRPEWSRVQGLRPKPIPPSWALFMSAFYLMGLAVVVCPSVAGVRRCRLLARGEATLGTLVSAESDDEPTPAGSRNPYGEGPPTYRMGFEFETRSGRRHTTIATTQEPWWLNDDRQELLLYDPQNPRRALLLDSLPGPPWISQDGIPQARDPVMPWLSLIPPLIVIAEHVLYLMR